MRQKCVGLIYILNCELMCCDVILCVAEVCIWGHNPTWVLRQSYELQYMCMQRLGKSLHHEVSVGLIN